MPPKATAQKKPVAAPPAAADSAKGASPAAAVATAPALPGTAAPKPRQNAWVKPLAPAEEPQAKAPAKQQAPAASTTAAAAAPAPAPRKTGGTTASKGGRGAGAPAVAATPAAAATSAAGAGAPAAAAAAPSKKDAPPKLNTGDLAVPQGPATGSSSGAAASSAEQPRPQSEKATAKAPAGGGATMVPGAFEGPDGAPSGGVAAAAAAMLELMQQLPSEPEFIHTAQMVQFVAQPALVQVMRSLLEDFPFLVPHVRVRCDQAMGNFLSQQQQQQMMSGQGSMFGGSAAGTPFMQSPDRGYGQHSHPTPSAGGGRSPHKPQGQYHYDAMGGSGSASPSPAGAAGTPGGSRGPKRATAGSGASRYGSRAEEEHDMCQRHGNMRAVKHLTYNATNRRVECVPGFHCLETRSMLPAAPTGAFAATVAPPAGSSKVATPAARVTPPLSGVGTPRSMATPSGPAGGGAALLPSGPTSGPPSPSKGKIDPDRKTPMLQGATPPPEDGATAESSGDRARLQALLSDLRT